MSNYDIPTKLTQDAMAGLLRRLLAGDVKTPYTDREIADWSLDGASDTVYVYISYRDGTREILVNE